MGASACTDIVSGGNKSAKVGGYSAGPGYDAASGWGTPDGMKLKQAIAGASGQPAPSPRVATRTPEKARESLRASLRQAPLQN